MATKGMDVFVAGWQGYLDMLVMVPSEMGLDVLLPNMSVDEGRLNP